jgi:hypothetical protein
MHVFFCKNQKNIFDLHISKQQNIHISRLRVPKLCQKGAKILFSIFEFFREISEILPNNQYLFDSPD